MNKSTNDASSTNNDDNIKQENNNEDNIETTFNSLEEAKLASNTCQNCVLVFTRTNAVFYRGNPKAKLMIIGEAPGQQEDEIGVPFVGKPGQLLDKLLDAVQINKEKDVYICNVIKCRLTENRAPNQQEIDCCWNYLAAQIKYVSPKIIALCGSTAVKSILKTNDSITKIRGRWYENVYGAKVIPVFHPSFLLRSPSQSVGSPKWLMCQDLREIKKQLSLLKD